MILLLRLYLDCSLILVALFRSFIFSGLFLKVNLEIRKQIFLFSNSQIERLFCTFSSSIFKPEPTIFLNST